MPRKLIFGVYRVASAAALPLFLLYVLYRVARDRRYARHLMQRFGRLPASWKATAPGAVWLHAVSVGEVISAGALIREIRAAVPAAAVYVSCTTLAGREVAGKRLGGAVDGIFFVPIDTAWAVRRVLRTLRPRLVVVLETEIWPNLFHEAKRSGAALLVANARISDAAFPKYLRFRWFFRTVLRIPDRILTQSDTDRQRYLALGADPARLAAPGNLKYDFDPRRAAVSSDLQHWISQAQAVWIAASTMPPAATGDPDEDDAVIDAWLRVRRPGRRFVLVPRKPERFDTAAERLRAHAIAFVRRTALRGGEAEDVLLLDTVGELAGLFRFATVIFMGGTLASRGGHNILEPAAFAKPVIVGPHMENFREIAARFAAAGATVEIANVDELAPALERLFDSPAERGRIGERARLEAEAEQGAAARIAAAAVALYSDAIPRVLPYGPVHPLLWALSKLWLAGGSLKRAATTTRRLHTPVVSVGGIAMGGAGKTPVVRALARALHDRGASVAILTRGYRRKSRERMTIVPAGMSAPVDVTGEEAQLYVRDGTAHVGIGADRYETGRAIESSFRPDLFLLDDGFQHRALARDLDIVVLDDVDPHAGGAVFPLGRLREPVTALSRADFVIRKAVRPVRWVPELRAGARVAAFCGLGNPESFWRTLADQQVRVIARHAFADHHRYSPAELDRICIPGIDALVTTEKDFMNLPPSWSGAVPVHYLEIEVVLEDRAALLERVERLLAAFERQQ